MATSLYKGLIPFRTKGQATCLHHKGGQLYLYCKNCKELACIKCLSTVHNSHPLCALSEVTSQQKRDIQNFVDKTERVDLVQVDKYIISTEEQLTENSKNFKKLSHKLKTQTNKLKHDLDQLTSQTLSLYQQMEEDNTKLLQTYKQNLEMYSAQLKQQVQECKIALQRGSDIQIYDTGRAIISPVTLPVKPSLGIAGFTPNENPLVHLEQALGEVNTSGQIEGQPLQGHDRSVRSSAGQRQSATRQRSETEGRTQSTEHRSTGRETLTSPVYTLLPQTTVLDKWRSPCVITSVSPTTDGQLWATHSNTLTLMDRKGKVIQKVKCLFGNNDISQSPTTNTLWICDRGHRISELVSGRLVHRFRTRDLPQCICITASNNVIVGMANNISKYTTKGNLVVTTSGTGKPLVCDPYRITECPVTHNVAVADLDSSYFGGGDDKPCVVVMDTDFKELFVYDGEVPHIYQPTSQSGSRPFNPQDVVYDRVGNLVIGDYDNKSILLISGRGEVLRVIRTSDCRTRAIGIDREGILWAVNGVNSVALLQYSSV